MSEEVEVPVPGAQKLSQATQVLTEILALMEVPAKLEAKDGEDGGISVALHFEGEVPGAQGGKRSNVVDSLQFLTNKIVNRAPDGRRWVSIGVGAHPAPRQPQDPKGNRKAQAQAPAAAPAVASAPSAPAAPAARPAPAAARPAAAARAEAPRPNRQVASAAQDESKLEVAEDAALAAAARELADKCARHGRYFALAPMSSEDRARVVQAARPVAGLKVTVEGEGRNRRVVFTPDKPTPMPKKKIPDYADEEDEA